MTDLISSLRAQRDQALLDARNPDPERWSSELQALNHAALMALKIHPKTANGGSIVMDEFMPMNATTKRTLCKPK
jgi:hypothetical protein